MTSMGRISETAERRAAARVPLGFVPAAPDLQVAIRPAAERADALAGEWTALAASASEPNVFAEHWFVAAALRTLPERQKVQLLEVRRGGRLIGLFLFEIDRFYARLPVAVVRNWCHDQAFLGTPLVAAGEERAFWDAAIDALNAADLPANLIHLWRMAEGGPVAQAFGGAIVHRRIRAFLESELSPAAYYERAVRGKKRKELRRQRNRLGDLGRVEARILADRAELDAWCDAYLALEKAGWKGREGTALACAPESEAFFRETLAGAWDVGRLQFRRLDLDGRPVAMLVNFLCPPGSFSFKTAFDEDFYPYSPGVLLQIENLDILDRPDIDWMDSCAVQDHPMIDSLWTERRSIVRCTLPLKGWKRRAVWAACRALELASARLRRGTDV
ncbi:MAG: GNAT family N-acetyltransferase [Sphingomonadaceae bacterium]|nr:GNAT family N-acetyltransferase [Sphingomonadaceae bacterium]